MATVYTGRPLHVPEAIFFAFDDYAIPLRKNLILTLQQPEKYPGNPVLHRGQDGEPDDKAAKLYGTVLYIDGKFRMWYTAEHQRQEQRLVYAESDDGINWVKPSLGLVMHNGSTNNNIIVPRNPEQGGWYVQFPAVLYEPEDDDPSKRYKMMYICTPEIREGATNWRGKPRPYFAYSADGLDWRLAGVDTNINEPFEATGLYKFGNMYFAAGQKLSPDVYPGRDSHQRVMVVSQSPDFVHWTDAKTIGFQRRTQPVELTGGEQIHMGAGLWNRGNVLVGIYGQWHGGPLRDHWIDDYRKDVTGDLGLIISNDGIHFREPVPDFKMIPNGGASQWDHEFLYQGHSFVNVGDKTYYWYSAWNGVIFTSFQEIGMVTWKRDCLGYLSAKNNDQPGHCLTTALALQGRKGHLFLNADGLSGQSSLTVELLDTAYRPLAGYSAESCVPLTGGGLRQAISWREKSTIDVDQPFVVKVGFNNAGGEEPRLYAIYLTE